MRLNLIYARAANGVIGKDNTLPWHLPEDMAHFKRHTSGCPVLMGRKTWDSLPPRFRPLPGRRNLVLTRQLDWQASGAERCDSLADALARCADAPEVWVIGGAQLYAQALAHAQRVLVTEIGQAFEGDAYAPVLDTSWHETQRDEQVGASGLPYAFVTLERRPGARPPGQ